MKTLHSVRSLLKKQPRQRLAFMAAGGVCVVAAGVFFVGHFAHGASASTTRSGKGSSPQVIIAPVSSLSPNIAPLSMIGTVQSQDEATVLSEAAGELVRVNVQMGNHVAAGEIIAVGESSSQEAAVQQAQGTYDAAEAALTKVMGTSAQNSQVNSNVASQTVQNQQVSSSGALQNAYASLDDAVHTKADQLFSNPTSFNPRLIGLTVPDSQLTTTVEDERSTLEQLFQSSNSLAADAATGNVDEDITKMITSAQTVETFLNNVIALLNQAVPNQQYSAAAISGYQSSLSSARSEVVGAITNLTAAKNTYDTSVAGATTAKNTANGATTSDVASAQAAVEQALGALNVAKAALAKTVVRSPISGVIIDLPVTSGDYVAANAEVAKVSNPGALKIVAYATPDDAQTLAAGNEVKINGSIPGVITQIAPAIDPATGEIEVDIGITGSQTGLIDGDSVTVDLHRSTAKVVSLNTSAIIIPIVALKISPTGPVVFTVDQTKHTLVAHAVSVGSILGENIVVTSGLTSAMVIVTDARGLTAGEIVSPKVLAQ